MKYLINHDKKIVFVLNNFGPNHLKKDKNKILQISNNIEKYVHNIELIQLEQFSLKKIIVLNRIIVHFRAFNSIIIFLYHFIEPII